MKKSLTKQELIAFCKEELSPMIGIPTEEIDIHANFDTLRLNSIHAMQLLDELEDYARIRLSPLLFWENPTIESFCTSIYEDHLKSSHP